MIPDWREALAPEYDNLPDEEVGNIVQGAIRGAQLGTALGPVGTVVGALGGAAISSTRQGGMILPKARTTVAPARQDAASAAQLLQVILHPEVIKALMALSLGDAGLKSVTVAGREVPTGAIASTVETLAGRTVEAYNAAMQDISDYLHDAEENFAPASPDNHADYILGLLSESIVPHTTDEGIFYGEDVDDSWELYEGED